MGLINNNLMGNSQNKKEYILFTSNNFPEGGPGATYLNLFCKGVIENGGKINVYLSKGFIYKNQFSNDKRTNNTDYGVNYTYLGLINRPSNKLLKISESIISLFNTTLLMFRLLFKRNKIVIFVYSNESILNLPVYILSRFFFINIISFVSEYYDKEVLKKLSWFKMFTWYSFILKYHFLNMMSNSLIVFSHFLQKDYIKRNFNPAKILIQPNLTKTDEWYIPDQKIYYTIGYAGTPSKKDGVDDLLEAINIIKKRGILVNALIIGDSYGGESFIPGLKDLCSKLDISDQINFLGLIPQKEVRMHLNSCKILAITRPNNQQTLAGFPTKLGEYMSCKKIVIATKFGDLDKYFTDKEDIILAEPDNPHSIADNIIWILNHLEESESIKKNGFKKANELLNYRNGVNRIMKLAQ